jgi:hypothetical protein
MGRQKYRIKFLFYPIGNLLMTGTTVVDSVYFSFREIGIILLLAVLAALSGAAVPSVLFPEGTISDLVYHTLGLPGPGAGVLIFGGILCFWLLAGLILVKKPGTAVAISVAIIAFDLLFGNQVILLQTMGVLVIVAIIIEAVNLVPADGKFWKNILPVCLAGLGMITLALALLGKATLGEADIPVAGFPFTYWISGILGLGCGFICYRYPVRDLLAAGIANMYYMLHFWLFWGTGFASRFPPDLTAIPVLLLVALLGGAISASAMHAIDLLIRRYRRPEDVVQGDQ